ncbi:MAG: DUF309 domain-containing protein [bacterium]
MTPPRYASSLPFPAYRYIPGRGMKKEEPRRDIPKIEIEILDSQNWRENTAYLYGMDLYHQGYYYEAHEVWEELWHAVGHETTVGLYLKALIQNAAAQLKLAMGELEPARRLSLKAKDLLEQVQRSLTRDSETWMGLSFSSFLEEMEHHYSPLWKKDFQAKRSLPPKTSLNLDRD